MPWIVSTLKHCIPETDKEMSMLMVKDNHLLMNGLGE